MSHLLFHDGQYYREDKPLVGANSRALRYGDGVFETMKVNGGRVQLGEWHMERLFGAMELLQFEPPSYFNAEYLLDRVAQLAHRNGHARLARIRLMVFRGNGGLYDPENHYPHHVIQSWSLPAANHEWNENGLVLGIHEGARKSMDILANCKTNNYLPYVMGALQAKKEKWNDALVLNNAGRIADATIANLFWIEKGCVFTPPLEEGPVAGIMRRYFLANLGSQGYEVGQASLTRERLLEADEVFLTNSSYGLRWVKQVGNKEYGSRVGAAIYQQVVKPLFLS